MALFLIANGPSPTTAAQVPVTTGTSIKTLLQVKPSATAVARIVEWGISFDGFAAALPIRVELIETDVAATVTAHVAAGIVRIDAEALHGGDPTTNLFPVGTTSTGYTASGEGSITASRVLDVQFIPPTNQFVKQFPLGREPIIDLSKFARIRVTAGTAVNAYCYMIVEI
ncbi:MAG: hypothetical protein JWP89_2648 [Schlesneria sp.]|nr:hypothetical protein [Schlesneria sp.]